MEIQIAKVKSIYGDLKGLLSQIPPVAEEHYVEAFTVNTFNDDLKELSKITNTDFSRYKVPISQKIQSSDLYASVVVYNGLRKLDTNLAKNRWKDMIKV